MRRSCKMFYMNETVGQLTRRLVGLAVRRPGLAVALWGEAGIGKTHITLALLGETPINFVSVRSTQPMDGVVGVIPKPKRASIWLERAAKRVHQGDALEAGELVQTLAGLLSANAPLILHVEDLHEAGPEQMEVWTQLALAVTRTRGVGLIATSRVPPPNGFEAFKLEPLDRFASDAALEVEAGGALPAEACAWIFEHARGNPLFTLEFFRFLSRHGFVWNDSRRWRWRVPDRSVIPITVEATIERVIAEAGNSVETRMALKARAYLESLAPNLKLEAEIWAHIASLEAGQLERAERNLWARGVLNESGFVHPLFREVSVNGLSIIERESFANRALEVLPLNIAGGFILDAQLGPAKSLEWLTRVAEASNTPGRWLAAAVEFAGGNERTRLALEAARELTSSDLRQAQKFYRLALKGSSDPAITLEFVTFLAPHQPDEARALFEALPEQVRTSDEGLVARFQMMVVIGDVRGIIDCWKQEFGSSSDLSPDALVHVIQSLKTLDHCDDAIRLADLVLLRSDLSPWQRARIMNRKTNAYNQSNRYRQALELTDSVLELLAAHGLPGRDVILSDHAMYQMHLGDYRSAQTDLEESVRLSQAIGRTPNEMMNRGFLGELHGEFGDHALAEEFLLDAFEYQVHHPVSDYLCDTVNALTELYLAWRDRPSSGLLAQKYARLSLEYAAVMGVPTYLAAACAYAGFVELEYGSPSRALELALEARAVQVTEQQFFGRWFPTWLEGKAQIKLGDRTRALGLLERTVAGFGQIGRVVQMNLAGFDLDRLRNDSQSARGRLEWFQERGMRSARLYGLRLFPELASAETAIETRAGSQLQVLGNMQMLTAGTPEAVRGGKRKELMALLLEARIGGRNEVPRLDLFDRLYPNSSESQASTALASLVFHLRESLGANTILSSEDGYALGRISSDAEVFLETGDTRLWRGPYLEGFELGGDETVREALHLALRQRAETLLETDPVETARLGRLLSSADPYDLESLRLTLRALRGSDNHKSLKSTYARARSVLFEIGEALPERWTEFLEG